MTKKLLRYIGPMALALGLTGGALAAGTAGASTANSAKGHHGHHQSHKPQQHHKKKK